MPQMAPLSWLFLFSVFSGLLILSAIKIYYSLDVSLKSKSSPSGGLPLPVYNKQFVWKW